jgi:ADP-glucose pyrophosphorylase
MSILGMNIRLHLYAYLNVSVIMADFQIGRT